MSSFKDDCICSLVNSNSRDIHELNLDVINLSLVKIINVCISLSGFPTKLKLIIPVYKKGAEIIIDQFRFVSEKGVQIIKQYSLL